MAVSRWTEYHNCDAPLKQQSFDSMSVDHAFAGRPRKYRETAILRRNQSHCVVLIGHELRRRKVTRSPELARLDDLRAGAFDRLCNDHVAHLRRSPPADDLRAEGEHLILVGQY